MIAVANQKGGVAKTTTVASLGAAWSQLGQRVLIVDLDPQACLTFSVGYDPESIELLGAPAVGRPGGCGGCRIGHRRRAGPAACHHRAGAGRAAASESCRAANDS